MSVFAVIKRRKPSIFSEFPVPSGVGTSLGQAGTKRGCENPMKNVSIALFIMFAMAGGALGQRKPLRQMERLSRGVVAVNEGGGKVFVGWRMFGTDPENIAFDLYRAAGASKAVKLNGRPISDVTFFIDDKADLTKANTYFVRPVVGKKNRRPEAVLP